MRSENAWIGIVDIDMDSGFMFQRQQVAFLPGYFTRDELLLIKQSAEKMIKVYEENNLTSDVIKDLNKAEIDREYECAEVRLSARVKVAKPTFIYLMEDTTNGFYKIGRSQNPVYREETLLALKPTIELRHTFKGEETDEFILHKKFAEKRIRGEWFSLDQNDVEEIKKYFNEE